MDRPPQIIYEFGLFRIDTERYLLLRGEDAIPLSPKIFETLLFLVQNRGQVCKKDDIMNRIWPDTFVEESNLAQNIFLLRRALGEGKSAHQYILTIPGVGYRFVAPVKEFEAPNASQKERPARAVGSMAVLPFMSMAGAEGQKFLGAGLADALITKLSGIRNMKVCPTTAVLRYSGIQQDPLQIGRELNVEAVLIGVYQEENQNLRVSVQLIRIDDRLTLWAAKFDEKFTDIFAIQDSISEQVVSSLQLKLSGEEQSQLRKSHTDSPEAFQIYIKGRYFWNQRTTDGLKRGLELAHQAIAVDPAYAPAYVALADSYSLLGAQHGFLAPRDSFPKARAAALRALEIDEQFAEAYASLGFVNCCFEWDWNKAEQNYRRAIELKPNYATAHHWYGELLTIQARFDEAYTELHLAQELDALSLAIAVDVAASFFHARQYDMAETQLRNLMELNANFVRANLMLGRVHVQTGNHVKALEMLRRAVELSQNDSATLSALAYAYAVSGKTRDARKILKDLQQSASNGYVSACNIAAVHIGLGETDLAYTWLEKALEDRDIELIWLKVNPVYDALRSDPRFSAFVRRVNTPIV